MKNLEEQDPEINKENLRTSSMVGDWILMVTMTGEKFSRVLLSKELVE